MALALAGCGRAESVDSLDRSDAGVTEAPARDRALPWPIVDAERLAAGDPDSPLHLVSSDRLIGIDSSGNIFAYSMVTDKVEVFDSAGRFVTSRGRLGGGPGEYRYVGGLTVRADGTLLVLDHGKGAVVGFAPDGTPLAERSYLDWGYAYGGVEFLADGVVIETREVNEQRQPVYGLRWATAGQDTTLADLRPRTLGQAFFQCDDGRTITLNGADVLFAPDLLWAVDRTHVAVARSDSYDIRIFESGHLERLIRRPLEVTPATTAQVRRQYPEGRALAQGRSCRQGPDVLAAALGVAEHLPLLAGLEYAPDGSLWARRFRLPGEEPIADVFGAKGEYLGSLRGPGFPIGFATGGRFVGLIPDPSTGGFQVHRYALGGAPW